MSAQVAVEAILQTDYRFRGYSITDGEPAATLSVNYDHASGAYVGGSITGTIRDGDPDLMGIQANVGYAKRLSPKLSIDAGLSRTEYFSSYGTSRDYHFTEAYLGVALPHISARLNYSPDYYRSDTHTLYAELDAGFEPAPDWFLSAHAGVLTYLDNRPFFMPRHRFDWRLGASRQLGLFGLHVDVSGRILGSPEDYVVPYPTPRPLRDKTAVVFSLTRAF